MPKQRPSTRRTTADVAKMIEDDFAVPMNGFLDMSEAELVAIMPDGPAPLDLSPGQRRFREDQKLIPPLPDSGPLCPCCGKPCTAAEYNAYGRHEDCAVSGWGPGKARPGESKVGE